MLIALFVLSGILRAHAHPHPGKTSNRPNQQLTNLLAEASDFDADVRQDRATLQSNGYDKTVKIRFGNARSSQVAFKASTDDAGRLVTGDIDRDGDVDLIWVGEADRKEAVVLLNDGEGNFAAAGDSAQYLSELDDLFNSGDPSQNRSLKRRQKTRVLASASLHDVGLPVFIRLQSTSIALERFSVHEPLTVQSLFENHLAKRGPPPSRS